MNADVFEWKQRALGGKTRVEVMTDAITVTHGERTKTIRYPDIRNIWFYQSKSRLSLIYAFHIEIETTSGVRAQFGRSGYGLGGGFDVEEARRASAAFFRQYQAAVGDGEVRIGLRLNNSLTLIIIFGALIYTGAMMFMEMAPQTSEGWWEFFGVLAGVLVITVGTMFWAFGVKKALVSGVLEKLSTV